MWGEHYTTMLSYPNVWCANDIEPSNCFFFETKSQCVAEW
jgi:hypothetical protein